VQRVVEQRDRGRGIAKRRVRGDVLDPLAVDVDFAAVAQRFQIFGAGEGPVLASKNVFGMLGNGCSPFPSGGACVRANSSAY